MTVAGPLADTLTRVGRLGPEFVLSPSGAGAGWIPATEFVNAGSALTEALRLRDAAAGGRVSRRALGSIFALHYLYYLWPAIAALSLERRVPDAAASNLLVRVGDEGLPEGFALVEPRFAALSSDPASGAAAHVGRDESELFAWALRRLVGDHAARLVEAVHAAAQTNTTILWGSVAAACALPLSWGAQLVADRALRDAPRLLQHPDYPQLHDRVDLRRLRHAGTEWRVHVRRTCCLYRRVPPGELCSVCPVLREPEATEHLERVFRATVAELSAGQRPQVNGHADAVQP